MDILPYLPSIRLIILIQKKVNLRFRLGVDARGNVFDQTSLGTIHPDIYRVMFQDGFILSDVNLDSPEYKQPILSHLLNDHLVLLLIKRRQNGNLHWVLASSTPDKSEENILIIDSLTEEPYEEPLIEFFPEFVVTALLVYRPLQQEDIDAISLNAMGAESARKALKRM